MTGEKTSGYNLHDVLLAFLCLACAMVPASSSDAAPGVAASALGEAIIVVPLEIGILTEVIRVADQDVPMHSDRTTMNVDSTKNGIHEFGNSIHMSSYAVSLGHAQADVQIVVSTTLTDAATGAKVGSKSSTARAHFDINACPDENGIAAGHVEIESQQETIGAGGQQSGGTASAKGPIRLIDGDDAHLIRSEMDVQEQADIHGYDSQTPFEAGISQYIPMSDAAKGPLVVDESHFTQQTTGDADKYKPGSSASLVETLFMSLTRQVAEQTENFWRSGKCIQLKPSEKSRDVAPHEKLSITVEALQRFDSKEVKAAIKGDLSGVESLEPNGKVIDPPAKFDFVAGPNQGDKGSIAFLQVGKRGIGKESLDFTVKCPGLSVAFEATYVVTGLGNAFDGRLVAASSELKCGENGMFHGTADMSVIGTWSGHGCHATVNVVHPVSLVAQLDETDSSRVRLGITPALNLPHTFSLVCPLRTTNTPLYLALELWGRMLVNRSVTIGKPAVITDVIRQGAGQGNTTTKISVAAPPSTSR